MRLVSAEVSSYRRFYVSAEMDLDADVICIVGPNGVGKSSFLAALAHLDHDEPFSAKELTRAHKALLEKPSVIAKFELDADDRARLRKVHGAETAQELSIVKRSSGEREYVLSFTPRRDRRLRERLEKLLAALLKSPWLAQIAEFDGDQGAAPAIEDLVSTAQAAIASGGETLGSELEPLEALLGRLRDVLASEDDIADPPKQYQDLTHKISVLIEHEREPHPRQQVKPALADRVPRFVKFEDRERNLKAAYDLRGEAEPAIENLLRLAGTSWAEAQAAGFSDDQGKRKAFIEAADAKLREELAVAWRKTPLTVGFELNETSLAVLMAMETHDYIDIDQHSDGLRQFVALRAFIAADDHAVKPIVLIDEADQHLHYDAQAELMTVFEEQDEAAKIVYTTHSAGCLPRDLAVGIRGIAVTTREEKGKTRRTDYSNVVDEIWSDDHGLSPLLIAMGAGAFAFSATRRALITEGFTDAFLLPTLLREATGKAILDYQVVPAFARAGALAIQELEVNAARVVYLADGDGGGVSNVEHLYRNDVAPARALYLGSQRSGLSLEDLIDLDIFLDAVNDELQGQAGGLRIPKGEIPSRGRVRAVEKWLAAENKTSKNVQLSKARLAGRVLRQRKKHRLHASAHTKTLSRLDRDVRKALA